MAVFLYDISIVRLLQLNDIVMDGNYSKAKKIIEDIFCNEKDEQTKVQKVVNLIY